MESPFEVLDLDPDADESEVDRAYRRRVKETHPDQGGTPEAFQRVRRAYEEIKSGRLNGDGDVEIERDHAAGVGPDGADEPHERAAAGPRHRARRPGSEPGSAGAGEQRERTRSRVEYVDYEALSDRGWSLDDEDLFEKAAGAELDPGDYGEFLNDPADTLLEGAETCGFQWPYSCRGGACANCAVALVEGEMEMPSDHILPEEMLDRGIRLSCIGTPVTEDLKVVYNVKHLPDLEELLLPPRHF